MRREDKQACEMSHFHSQDDGTKYTAYCVWSTHPENISIKAEFSAASICFLCLRRSARPCCSLSWLRGDQCDIPDDEPRDSRNLPVSASPYLTAAASATIRKIYQPRGWLVPPPPSPAFPWTWGRPTCRCWSGKERGGSGRRERGCIWKSGRFRGAKLRREAAGVLPASRCTSGTSEHRRTVISGHRRTDSLTVHTGFYWDL